MHKIFFLRDTEIGVTTLISQSSNGTIGDNFSYNSKLSADSRYVLFESTATNLVSDDTNNSRDVFLRDTQSNTTTLISQSSAGEISNGWSNNAQFSPDSRYVLFESTASNLVENDTNNARDIFLRDTQTNTTTLISHALNGGASNGWSDNAHFSADGHYIYFESTATNLSANTVNNARDVFLRDTQTGVTTLISQNTAGNIAGMASTVADISSNGRYVLFESDATNLAARDTNNSTDVFLRDTQTGITHLVSHSTYSNAAGTGGASYDATLSDDGRYVVFKSNATNLDWTDNNNMTDVFLHDMHTGITALVSKSAVNFAGNNNSYNAQLSADNQFIVFSSEASNLIAGDINTSTDIYRTPVVNTPVGIYDGSLNISGSAIQHQVLTANYTFSDIKPSTSVSYQWLESGSAIYGATSNTLTLAQSHVGDAISLKATYTDTQGVTKTILAMATDVVANVNDPVTGQVTISGTTTQNETLTAVTSTLADLDGVGTLHYQWFAGNDAISGATASTFALTQAQVGKTISVKVSYTDWYGAAESVTSAATRAIANANDAPTGSVTITGTITQGEILTASNTLADDADGMGTISYQWLANGQAINGATGETLSLTQALVGKTISVQAIYVDGFNSREVISSASTDAVANANDPLGGSVTLSGTTTQGRVLTATHRLTDADGLTGVTYTWLADGVVIEGATANTFSLSQAQVGKAISVRVSGTDTYGNTESITSATTRAIANLNDAPTGSVTITGTVTQGEILTASNTLADDADGMGTISYQWLVDGRPMGGATGETLELTQALVGKAIRVKASYTDGQGTVESITSAATTAVANINDPLTGELTVTGSAIEGQTLTATQTLADADGLGRISYQWLADGVAIEHATASTLTLSQAQVGKTISVRASYTDGQGTAESLTSTATEAVINTNNSVTGRVTITGTVTQNQVLTATHTLVDNDGLGVLSYQWLADGVALEGATESTFTLTQAQVGKAISVTISYTDLQGTAESVTSAATRAVLNVNDAPTGSVTISGTPTEGQTLSAANTLADDADGMGTISYQWLANGRAISGATGETLLLNQTLVGKTIRVKASYTDGQGTVENITSDLSSSIVNINDAPTGSVTITGTATQGRALNASHNLVDNDGLGRMNYQWLADGVAITGATASTLTLSQAEVGKIISVQANYTDGQGTAESVTSAATRAVLNVNDLPTGSVTISGTASEGQTLTAVYTQLADLDGLGQTSYQWLANGRPISGATGETLTLTQAHVGAVISVKVSYTDLQNTNERVTSAATVAVTNTNDAPGGELLIDGLTQGKALFGHELTANNTLHDGDGIGTFTYQWLANGVAINGATTDKFTPTPLYDEKNISVRVTYVDLLGTTESVQSDAAVAAVDTQYGDITRTGFNDRLQGGIFTTILYGNGGDDVLHGDSGNDYLYGGQDNDVVHGDGDNDQLEGEQGNDSLYGGDGNDTLNGGVGRDSLYGGNGDNGDNGDDALDGGSDRDFMDGGNGIDTYYIDNTDDNVRDMGTDGAIDVLYVTTYLQGGFVVGVGVETATLLSAANNTALTGNSDKNTFIGNNGHNQLNGMAGADTLNAGSGNDTLIGGAGKDELTGGIGNDIFKLEKSVESGITAANRDIIQDFTHGQDKISLSSLDANTQQKGDQAFTVFIGANVNFSKAGQLKFKEGVLYGNTDADSTAEFSIELTGISSLTLSDFIG